MKEGLRSKGKWNFTSKMQTTSLQFVFKLQQLFCGSWSSSQKG